MSTANLRNCLIVLSLLTIVICPFIGPTDIPLSVLGFTAAPSSEQTIFWQLRLPRVVTAYLAGAFLAVGGVVFQAIFRNPLASPFTLGVSAGAAFGVALYLQTGLAFLVMIPLAGVTSAALLGAFATVLFVIKVSRVRPDLSETGLLLTGVIVNFIFSSLVVFLQYISNFAEVFQLTRWLMGGLDIVGNTHLLPLIVLGLPALLLILRFGIELDLLVTGEELAASKGVDIRRVRTILVVSTSMMIAGVIAVCGPIAFIGIILPHTMRSFAPDRHRVLIPLCALGGGLFLVLCDTLARIALQPLELPVGIITSALGGPFFLALLLRQGDRNVRFS